MTVLQVQWNLQSESVLSHFLLLHIGQIPSTYVSMWDTIISICLWKHPLFQVISLLLVLCGVFSGKYIIHLGVSLFSCILHALPSMYQSFALTVEMLLKVLSILILLQIEKPSLQFILLMITCLPLSESSLLGDVLMICMMVAISYVLCKNCLQKKQSISVIGAYFVLLLSYITLVILFLYAGSLEKRVFGVDERLFTEIRETASFLKQNKINQYYLKTQEVCFGAEELYYHLLGYPYEYIVYTPFDEIMDCPGGSSFFEAIRSGVEVSYLANVFVSSNRSFLVYHIVQ